MRPFQNRLNCRRRLRRNRLAVVAALFAVLPLSGCDGRSTVQPTSSSARPLIPSFSLSGRVVDTAYRPLAGSRVEVVSGLRAGSFEITDEAGRFSMPGMFTDVATVKASRDGYLSETATFPPPNRPPSVEGGAFDTQFYLAPTGPTADIAGLYTLTMTVDPSCRNLPAEARTRSYTAAIAPGVRSGFFMGRLSDARFFSITCPPGRPLETCTYNQFGIGLAGDYASIGLGVVEQLDETTFLAFEGGTAGSFGPTGIAGPFDGFLLYCPAEPVWNEGWVCPVDGGLQCDSHTHQLTLMRR